VLAVGYGAVHTSQVYFRKKFMEEKGLRRNV